MYPAGNPAPSSVLWGPATSCHQLLTPPFPGSPRAHQQGKHQIHARPGGVPLSCWTPVLCRASQSVDACLCGALHRLWLLLRS